MIVVHRLLTRAGSGIVAFALGVVVTRLVNEASAGEVHDGFWRGLWGLARRTFDPADNDTNVLFLVALSVVVGIPVAKWAVRRRYASRGLHAELATVLAGMRHHSLSQYPQICFQQALSLQVCPFIVDGWSITDVRIDLQQGEYRLPAELVPQYRTFAKAHAGDDWMADDRTRYMLVRNPASFTDCPKLSLLVRKTCTSVGKFTSERLTGDEHDREEMLREAVTEGDIRFPHRLCLQLVVVTSDDKVLITQRSHKVDCYRGQWSCSLEEQMDAADLRPPPKERLLAWARRALEEELGLYADQQPTPYVDDNIKLLSVFIEGNNMNVSLCGYARLELSSDAFGDRLRNLLGNRDRRDTEHTAFAFLGLAELFTEVFRPTRDGGYHPTSRYRMLMYLLHRFGETELARQCRRRVSGGA